MKKPTLRLAGLAVVVAVMAGCGSSPSEKAAPGGTNNTAGEQTPAIPATTNAVTPPGGSNGYKTINVKNLAGNSSPGQIQARPKITRFALGRAFSTT